MNRRNFMKFLAVVPMTGLSRSIHEIREELIIGDEIEANIIVSAHPAASSAETYRRAWIGQPFETYGEWYVMTSKPKQLPKHLGTMPGTLTLVETRIGEAGEERNYLVGAFRRDHIVIVVRIIGGHEETMMDIGEHIAAQKVPTLFETTWSPVQLRAFVPGSSDLGTTVEPHDGFWP